MKWFALILLLFLSIIVHAQIGKVGINTATPAAMLHVGDSSVLFTGKYPVSLTGDPPVSGPGTRMMWYPGKAAFRVGYVNGTQWDKDNIGTGSMALGSDTKASGSWSIALGVGSVASGHTATAIGLAANASGGQSIAMGYLATASGKQSVAAGIHTKSKSYGGTVIGTYNDSTDASNQFEFHPNNRLFQIGNGSADYDRSNALTVLQNGNIGIGTTTPAYPLNFPSSFGNKISLWGSGQNHYGFGVQNGLLQIYSLSSSADVAFGYGNSTSFTETMRVKGNGNVGIGTTSPSLRLHVAKNTNYGAGSSYGIAATNETNSNLRLNLGYDSTIDAAVIQASHEGSTFNKNLLLNPNAGKVGIGITSPEYMLDVGDRIRLRAGPGGTAGIWFNNDENTFLNGFIGNFSDEYIGLYGGNGAGWSVYMNTTNGNVGIGTGPSEKLHVAGNGLFTGTVTADCGVLVCSDIRYKKDILPVTNALSSLQSIHGIYYHWDQEKFTDKAFSDERQIGFSAQELEAVYPEMVKTDAAGYKTVDYSRLTPVLVEAIKEQQAHIEDLVSQVSEQNKRIEILIREVEFIKNKAE